MKAWGVGGGGGLCFEMIQSNSDGDSRLIYILVIAQPKGQGRDQFCFIEIEATRIDVL